MRHCCWKPLPTSINFTEDSFSRGKFLMGKKHMGHPPFLWWTFRKTLWLDLQPADIKSRWRHNWKLAQVVNSHLVCDPTILQPGFDLPRQQWSLLNHFCTEQGHCGACRKKWWLSDTDLCSCGVPWWCPTLSNPVPWWNWMVAYLSYTLRMKTVFRG